MAIWSVFVFVASSASGQVMVDFSGGDGSPLSITLPAMEWEIADISTSRIKDFAIFGVAIAVGQDGSFIVAGDSVNGNAADWSASHFSTFSASSGVAFYENQNFTGPHSGGIIWWGMESNQATFNGEIFSYAGGTIGNDSSVAGTFIDGSYDVYIISGSGAVASTAGVAVSVVPESSTYPTLIGAAAMGFYLLRRRHKPV